LKTIPFAPEYPETVFVDVVERAIETEVYVETIEEDAVGATLKEDTVMFDALLAAMLIRVFLVDVAEEGTI
jgi:hypothetical protein